MATSDPFDHKRMSFGALLRNFRVRRMLSIRELAKSSGVSRSQISLLEQDRRRPSFRSLRCLCGALALEGEEFATFCDAALRQAPAHMKDRPAEGSSLEAVLGSATTDHPRGFGNLRLPDVTDDEREFLTQTASGAQQRPQASTSVHCRPQASPDPQESIKPTSPHAQRAKWSAPIRRRPGAVRKTKHARGRPEPHSV